MLGSDVTFGRTRSTGEPRQYNMVYAYRQRDVGLEAGELALKLLLHLLPETLRAEIDYRFEEDFDFGEQLLIPSLSVGLTLIPSRLAGPKAIEPTPGDLKEPT